MNITERDVGKVSVACQSRLLASILFIALLSTCKFAQADFRLPVFYPVPKIISVPENGSMDLLARFENVHNLVIEIRMEPSSLPSDQLIKYLNGSFPKNTKIIATSGLLRSVHANRFRKLYPIEIRHYIGLATLDPKTINSLYTLGPVRKMLVLNSGFGRASFSKIRKVKFSVPVIRLGHNGLSKEQLTWLSESSRRPIVFVLSPGFNPVYLEEIENIAPVGLEVHTINNRIEMNLLTSLSKLKKTDITVVVDGGFTMQDAYRLYALDRFSIKVQLENDSIIIPGLADLLNQIAPL